MTYPVIIQTTMAVSKPDLEKSNLSLETEHKDEPFLNKNSN